jgi:cation:H+ antiporter
MLRIDIPVMLVASLALIPIMRSGGRISRLEGGALFAGYIGYLLYLLSARTGAA